MDRLAVGIPPGVPGARRGFQRLGQIAQPSKFQGLNSKGRVGDPLLSVQEDRFVGLEEGVGEFGPGVDGGQRRVHRDAAGGAVVCAAFFAGGHGGDFVGDALFAFRFLGTRDGEGERDFEGFAGGVRFYVADAE